MDAVEITNTPRFFLWLMIFGTLTLCAALVGVTYPPDEWFAGLAKPDWMPPPATFGIVWTALYALIAIAGCLVWTKRKTALANLFWTAQLIVNGLWSMLFFGAHRMDLALLDVAVLWLLIAGFIWTSWRVSKLASLLFVPYLGWVTIAAALNAHIWLLNGTPIGQVAMALAN